MDELDIFILKKILLAGSKSKEITTWSIAKEYNWEDKNKFFSGNTFTPQRYYTKKTCLIKNRLKYMSKFGIVKITKENNKNIYEVINNKVYLKKYKFPDDKIKESICIFISDKWNIYQI